MERLFYTILLIVLIAVQARANDHNKTSFYVVAHQDDWQLFMGDKVFNDVIDTDTRVVIIHTTAGDASCGRPLNMQYYKAREIGAIYSLEFCAAVHSVHNESYFDTLNINGHNIRRFKNKNVTNYFLLMPDGCFKTGWNGQSLEYLQNGSINIMQTVDGANLYNGWEDVVSTLKAIITNEMGASSNMFLNIADIDIMINPDDHPDHIYTALGALEAISDKNNITANLFTEYHSGKLPPNRTNASIALKGALYALADFSITQNNITTTWFNHQEYIAKTYYRTINSGTEIDSLISNFLGVPSITNAKVYPNPSHNAAFISYKIATECNVDIKVFNQSGQFVLNVMNGTKAAGYHTTKIDISILSGGIYFVIIQTPFYKNSIKLIVY